MPKLVSFEYAHRFPLIKDFIFNGELFVPGKTTLLTPDDDDKFEEEGIAWCKKDVNPKRPIFFKEDTFRPGPTYLESRIKTYQ